MRTVGSLRRQNYPGNDSQAGPLCRWRLHNGPDFHDMSRSTPLLGTASNLARRSRPSGRGTGCFDREEREPAHDCTTIDCGSERQEVAWTSTNASRRTEDWGTSTPL